MTTRQKRLLGIVLRLQALLTVAAWRDLARRTEDQIRGRKNVWRAFVLLSEDYGVEAFRRSTNSGREPGWSALH
jgi:hypothetical protein